MKTIKEIKEEAKVYFRGYYWSSVFANLILVLFGVLSVSFVKTSKGESLARSLINLVFYQEKSAIDYAVIVTVFLFILVSIALSVFVTNVIKTGGSYFHLHCRNENGDAVSCTDVFWGFKSEHFGNIVKVMFIKYIRILLWSLLFIIPGIIASFRYALTEYIIAENPKMGYHDAIAISSELMKGNKWRLFVIYLSFILWELLNVLTFGLLGFFWVNPYKQHTVTAFYATVKNEKMPWSEIRNYYGGEGNGGF